MSWTLRPLRPLRVPRGHGGLGSLGSGLGQVSQFPYTPPATRPLRIEFLGAMYHVTVTFPHPVSGPLAIGAGRYRGLGLFACEE